MKVSIVTPSYNCAAYLRGTIESVMGQRYVPIEHIVVDGGSSDGTVEILRSYPHLRWVSEPDSGMYDAINKGIRMASGEIIGYLNADDRYFDHTVVTVVEAFHSNPQIDFVYGYCEYTDTRGHPLFVLRPLPYTLARRSLRILWPQPTCFWRKRIHERVGFFDTALRALGDADFFARMIVAGLHGMLVRKTLAKFMLRCDCLSFNVDVQREWRTLRERYIGFPFTSPIAEAIFAVFNLQTYPYRLARRLSWRMRRRSLGGLA